MPHWIDISGEKFGRLTAVKIDREKMNAYKKTHNGKTKTFWECICECGGVTVTNYQALTEGSTKSCGCLRKKRGKYFKC